MTDRLSAMHTFVRVVETGSFTAVAKELGVGQPFVSKRITWLEAQVGNRLIERTTRRLLFTDRALEYYEQCKAILDTVETAERSVRDQNVVLSGELRVSASIGFGSLLIAPWLPKFLTRYPGLTVDMRLSDDFVDVLAEGIDIAFRLGPPASTTSTSRPLGHVRPIFVASREYCERFGRPDTIDDLASYACIVISGRPKTVQWQVEGAARSVEVAASGPVRTNSGMGAKALVLANAGIALLPGWLFIDELVDGTVVRLLPGASAVRTPLHAVTPVSRRHSMKVKHFLADFEPVLRSQID